MSKQFIAVIVIVVLGLFGIFSLTKKSDNGQNGSSTNAQASEHEKGAGNKGVVLTEYGDFQCPHCKTYHPLVKQLGQEYGDDITIQFRHFPLNQIHPHAFQASRAAEAAGKQGKFFEMHDLLFENQDSWSQQSNVTPVFEGYAQQLMLNMDQFKKDMASSEVAGIINADLKAGQALGIKGTPAFVINGNKIDTPSSLEEFKRLIDEEIAKKQ